MLLEIWKKNPKKQQQQINKTQTKNKQMPLNDTGSNHLNLAFKIKLKIIPTDLLIPGCSELGKTNHISYQDFHYLSPQKFC